MPITYFPFLHRFCSPFSVCRVASHQWPSVHGSCERVASFWIWQIIHLFKTWLFQILFKTTYCLFYNNNVLSLFHLPLNYLINIIICHFFLVVQDTMQNSFTCHLSAPRVLLTCVSDTTGKRQATVDTSQVISSIKVYLFAFWCVECSMCQY